MIVNRFNSHLEFPNTIKMIREININKNLCKQKVLHLIHCLVIVLVSRDSVNRKAIEHNLKKKMQ